MADRQDQGSFITFWNYFKKIHWLSKDVIVLILDKKWDENEAMETWVNKYHSGGGKLSFFREGEFI